MERLNGNVGSAQGSFKQRPKILDALSVNLPVDVGFGMLHNVMHEPYAQVVISEPFIRVDLRSVLHSIQDFFLQGFTLHVGNDLGADFAHVTLQHSHNDSLALRSDLDVVTDTLFLVHVLQLSADECLIGFDWARTSAKLSKRAILKSQSQTVQDKPSGFLSDSQVARNFVGRYTVLAVHKHPERREPFVQGNGRILEDRPDLDGELATALFAFPALLRGKVMVILADALRAGGNAIFPSQIGDRVNAGLLIREIPDSLLKRLDLRVHVQTLPN